MSLPIAWRRMPILLAVGLIALLTSCAPGPNGQMGLAAANGGVAGFWLGIWQGLIAPVTFIISLFSSHVQPYEVHNNGAWYNFGFLLGINAALGGHAARRTWRR